MSGARWEQLLRNKWGRLAIGASIAIKVVLLVSAAFSVMGFSHF